MGRTSIATRLASVLAVFAGCSGSIAPSERGEPAGSGVSSPLDATPDGIDPAPEAGASPADAADTTDAMLSERSVLLPEAGALWDGRAPQDHVASRSACPQQRGPGFVGCYLDGGAASPTPLACLRDSDCTMGENGRCTLQPVSAPAPPDAGSLVIMLCGSSCSYDTCFSDSDCPAHVPCACRPSATDNGTNVCLTGSDCAVDADCGPGEFCSPTSSAQTQWQVLYFCHTANDACLDESDCPSGDACEFDTVSVRWICDAPLPIMR